MTIRRIILDKYLQRTIYFGSVLDVGGKAQNKRGGYRPNLDSVKSWEYLNLDESSSPDYLMDVKDLGQINKTFDCILLCEVLEHVEFPEKLVDDCLTILNKEGILIISIPFMYPFHPDPTDYQRWSIQKIDKVLENKKVSYEVKNMGGLFSVIHDLVHFTIYNNLPSSNFTSVIYRGFAKIIISGFKILSLLDTFIFSNQKNVTTGFFIKISK